MKECLFVDGYTSNGVVSRGHVGAMFGQSAGVAALTFGGSSNIVFGEQAAAVGETLFTYQGLVIVPAAATCNTERWMASKSPSKNRLVGASALTQGQPAILCHISGVSTLVFRGEARSLDTPLDVRLIDGRLEIRLEREGPMSDGGYPLIEKRAAEEALRAWESDRDGFLIPVATAAGFRVLRGRFLPRQEMPIEPAQAEIEVAPQRKQPRSTRRRTKTTA